MNKFDLIDWEYVGRCFVGLMWFIAFILAYTIVLLTAAQ